MLNNRAIVGARDSRPNAGWIQCSISSIKQNIWLWVNPQHLHFIQKEIRLKERIYHIHWDASFYVITPKEVVHFW